MPTAQQDTEITLGTGRMLALFFTFVLVCAFFFAVGFSLGRRTADPGSSSLLSSRAVTPSTVVRPSPAKNETVQPTPQSDNFSFYKAVGEKSADSGLTPAEAKTLPTTSTAPAASAGTVPNAPTDVPAAAAPSGNSYFVQVAAVTRQEDADALVEALKKKQYPAFMANNPATDKFYHVQVGPYGELKEAEAMRSRLISDGYNPIVKK